MTFMTDTFAPTRTAAPKPPTLRPERPTDAARVADLVERAFGPGRYAKAAERLRENNTSFLDISFVAVMGEHLVGCVCIWPITIGETPAVFLGPIAVDPEHRKAGLGGKLIRRSCATAADAGHGLVLLVGDPPLFWPHGFRQVPPGRIVMPGPVDPGRVLALPLRAGAEGGLAGVVRPG
jgi:predicted N-acetyltransferase YhbS